MTKKRLPPKLMFRTTSLSNRSVPKGFGSPNAIISSTNCQHRYFTNNTLTAPSGLHATQVFRGNGMQDPDFTGVGHQPLAYDQLATLYKYNRVNFVRVKVQFVNLSSSNIVLACRPSKVTTALSDVQEFCEQPMAVHKLIGDNTIDPRLVTMAFEIDVPKFLGLSYNDDILDAVDGGFPNRVVYIHVAAFTHQGAPAAINVPYTIELEYFAKWHTPLGVIQKS